MRYYSNVAVLTTLADIGGISVGATELTPTSTTGFPGQYPYTLRLEPDTSNEELVTVTGPKPGSPGVLLVTRAQDGTTAKSHAAGSVIVHGVSARDFQEPQDHMATETPGAVHGLPVSAWDEEWLIFKDVDQSYSSDTTLNDDTVLKFTAEANSRYAVELFAVVSGVAGGDVRIAWGVPSGASGTRSVFGPATSITNRNNATVNLGAYTFSGEIGYGLASAEPGAPVSIQERFIITTSATGGTVVFRHAQNTSNATATIIRGSSYMRVKKLAIV
jgi:hypothetical protein